MAGKIRYNTITIDFAGGWNEFNLIRNNIQSSSSSVSGIKEVLSFYNQDNINITREWLNRTELQELERWFEYVRDGSSFEFWRDEKVGMFLTFEGKSTSTNDRESAVFTRVHAGSDLAYVLDPYTELITSIATDISRHPSGKFTKGSLLIEGEATNLCQRSEDFSVVWAASASMTVTTNQAIAPDGTVTADNLSSAAASQTLTYNTTVNASTDDAVFSVWARTLSEGSGKSFKIKIGTSAAGWTEVATSSKLADADGWQKFTVSYNSVGDLGVDDWMMRIEMENGIDINFWGAQFVAAKRYSTSYMKTIGAGVSTRQEEVIYYSLTDDNFNKEKWSMSCWINVPYIAGEIESNKTILHLTESGTSNAFMDLHINTSGEYDLTVYDYGTNANNVVIDATSSLATINTWVHVAITCDSTINNTSRIYINGSLVATDTNDSFTPNDFDRLYIGSKNAAGVELDGKIDEVLIYKDVLSASEINWLSRNCYSMGYRRNYWDAVRLSNPQFNPIQKIGTDKYIFNAEFEEIL